MSAKQAKPSKGERIISRALSLLANGKTRGWSDALAKARKTI